MSKVTITFDPDDIFTPSNLTAAAEIRPNSARTWLARNSEILPEPLFSFKIPRSGVIGDMVIRVWSGDDGRKIVETYLQRREAYDAART